MVRDVFEIKQGDTAPAIARTLLGPDGLEVNLTSATEVLFIFVRADGGEPAPNAVAVIGTATIVDAARGAVSYAWSETDTATAGEYLAEWQVRFTAGVPPVNTFRTFPPDDYIMLAIASQL